MKTPDFSLISSPEFLTRLEDSSIPVHDPFQLRHWIDRNFSDLSQKDKLWLSQSLSLRSRLPGKNFPFSFWWITKTLFEMATDFRIARFHAGILREMTSSVTDLTAGSGFDLLAFSFAGLDVTAHETNQDTAILLERNLLMHSVGSCSVKRYNGLDPGKPVPEFWFADPMRRSEQARTVLLDSYSPKFSDLVSLTEKSAGGLIKISPMTNLSEQSLGSFCKVIVSLGNECKEILLIHGDSKIKSGSLWIDGTLYNPESKIEPPEQNNNGEYTFLFEPDPAVMKSGQLSFWSEKCGLGLTAPDSGFPQGSKLTVEHLFKPFLLIDSLVYRLNDIKSLYKKYYPRRVVLKKKNISLKIESIEKELGSQINRTEPPVYFLITSENSKPVVYVTEPVSKIHLPAQNGFLL